MEPVAFTAGSAVPVLKVSDVQRSIAWYGSLFGFKADPFPDSPPYVFAILCRDGAQIMPQGVDATGDYHRTSRDVPNEWDVDLRVQTPDLHRRSATSGSRRPYTQRVGDAVPENSV
jgi:hypothetical protein